MFWTLAGAAINAERWRTMQLRVNGLQKSFQKNNYVAGKTRVNANDILHPRNAERAWSLAYCKGLEKIAASQDVKLFLIVIDKRTTDKPAHPKWLLPLCYHYLMKPIAQFLKENNSVGTLVIPPGREEERQTIQDLQLSNVFASLGKANPLVGSPLIQTERESVGLQIADFVATTTRRYHEAVYPKLFAKETLQGYDAVINSHYQGFVKPHTYQSSYTDPKGFKIRGYIYLWRREQHGVVGAHKEEGEDESILRPSTVASRAAAPPRPRMVAEEETRYGTSGGGSAPSTGGNAGDF
jgi:hypothetical protein